MQIFICDDELPILNNIIESVQKLIPNEDITGFSSAQELLHALHHFACDVLFLDIDMPKLSGMDIAKELNQMEHKPLLVFVTNHDELVYESLQYHPFGFIRKSHFHDEIEKVLADCKKELGSRDLRFHFKMSNRNVVILLSDILYFEADGNYLKVYTASEVYRFRSTVTAVENSLETKGFIRVHKGFLVNQSAVKIIGRDELEMINGTRIPLGKSYMETAKQQLLKSMRI